MRSREWDFRGICCNTDNMSDPNTVIRKRRGRPRVPELPVVMRTYAHQLETLRRLRGASDPAAWQQLGVRVRNTVSIRPSFSLLLFRSKPPAAGGVGINRTQRINPMQSKLP